MGFFGGKAKVRVEDFCRSFYDSQVFHAEIGGIDVVQTFLDIVKKQLEDADPSFAAIDKSLFRRELTALRLELFGLAWLHKFKEEQFTIPQSIFTRRYLEENQKVPIWEIMGEYNLAIADSVTLTATGQRMEDRNVMAVNATKSQMFENWCEANLGGRKPDDLTESDHAILNCVARVINQYGADLRQRNGIGAKRVSARLADRLGCSPDMNDDALLKMMFTVRMLYDGAKEAIKSVDLQT
jgi:hypothetical protein